MENENKLAVLSLLDNNTEYIRNKLGIHNCQEFIEYIAKQKNISIDAAKDLIKHNIKLMALMFSIA